MQKSQTALALFIHVQCTGLFTHFSSYFQLLIEHEVIAPDPTDPLRVILRDLGPAPSVEGFLGTIYCYMYMIAHHAHVKHLLGLTLASGGGRVVVVVGLGTTTCAKYFL